MAAVGVDWCSLSQVSVTGQCHRSVSQVSVTGQCHRSVSQVSVTGQCHRSVSQVSVTGQCHRSVSQSESSPNDQYYTRDVIVKRRSPIAGFMHGCVLIKLLPSQLMHAKRPYSMSACISPNLTCHGSSLC